MHYRILLTGAGAPGTSGSVYCIKKAFEGTENSVTIVGSDCDPESVGKYLVDEFIVLPNGKDPLYSDALLGACQENDIDIVVPQTTQELEPIAKLNMYGQIKATISSPEAVRVSENKGELINIANKLGIPTPKSILIRSLKELNGASKELGYPHKDVVIKPTVSSGGRGFRILSAGREQSIKDFISNKPGPQTSTVDDMMNLIDDGTKCEFIVSEFLPGKEWSVDCFRDPNTLKSVIITRTRDKIVNGISFRSTITHNPDIIKHCDVVSSYMGLEYNFGFQFKEDHNGCSKLIECNSRIQGTMVASMAAGVNLIGVSVLSKLGLKTMDFSIKWGTRINRFWGNVLIP